MFWSVRTVLFNVMFCHSTPTQSAAVFAGLLSFWAITTGKLLGPKMGNNIQCLSQVNIDALLNRESNGGFATFRSIIQRFTNKRKNPGFWQALSFYNKIFNFFTRYILINFVRRITHKKYVHHKILWVRDHPFNINWKNRK